MTNHVARLYAFALALLVFFVTWAAVAARPWATTASADPRLAALAARERRLHGESIAVRRIVQQRWAVYRAKLHAQRARAAATPSVRVVTLPPLTITRTS